MSEAQSKPSYQELEKRLAVAEPIVEALKRHEVDAVVGEEQIAFLLLREVREALVNSQAGFAAMFMLPGVAVAQADSPAFRFTRVSQKFCDITGYSAVELLASTYIGFTHPQDRQRDMKGFAQVLQGKADSWSIEKRCLRKDESVIWLNVSGAAVRDDAGRTVRIIVMIREMAALKDGQKDKPTRNKKSALKSALKSLGADSPANSRPPRH
jgi:PAS domain S-box-containing protein